MLQQLSFVNEHAEECTGLRVFFVPTRTVCTGMDVDGIPDGASVVSASFDGYGAEVRWSPDLPPGARVDLTFRRHGEPLAVAQVSWQGADGVPALPYAGSLDPSAYVLAAAGAMQPPEARATAMFLARCAIVDAHPEKWFRDFGAFFCDLDLQTNPKLFMQAKLPEGEAKKRLAKIWIMEDSLRRRLFARTKGKALASSPVADIEYISGILLNIYRKHLGAGNGTISPDLAWDAFSRFANGELRVPPSRNFEWNGEPNSGALFCFAEFGFMAHENGCDAAEWASLLPSHVAIQPIFAAAYCPDGPVRFDEYRPENWKPEKRVHEDTKAEIWARFRDMEVPALEQAMTEHLRQVFGGK